MYLKKSTSSKTGRTYLSIVHGYWDADRKQSRTRTVKKLGFLDELELQYDDPISFFSALAASMEDERQVDTSVTLTLDSSTQLARGLRYRKNFGYVVLSHIYHELEIDRFLKNARRHENFKFNSDAIMRLLVYSRILHPASKRATVIEKDRFFDSFDFTLDDVYSALTHFHSISSAFQRHLHEMITTLYDRDTTLVYYDVTNYYFEIDKQDDLRKKGAEKNHRKDPIVQMGLLLDSIGLPIAYRLFPGNTHDSQTLMPILTEVKKSFSIGRIIVVADKGLNSGDNIAYNTILGDGYVFSKSVRGASDDFKKWMLDDTGYRHIGENFRVKSKVVPDAVVRVTTKQVGRKKTRKEEKVEQKWVVFYSEDYADRSRHKRAEAIAKAIRLIENPSKYRRTFDYGAAGYIQNLKVDNDTGEILNTTDTLILDLKKIEDEELFDGYYALITSELDDSDEHIIEMYRGLWRIEESFKISKSVLEARPVYLQTKEHIDAHFLICFVSLLITRILELKLKRKYSIASIIDTIRNLTCSNIDQNFWLFDFTSDISDAMNPVFNTNFGQKIMTLQEIKKFIGDSKL